MQGKESKGVRQIHGDRNHTKSRNMMQGTGKLTSGGLCPGGKAEEPPSPPRGSKSLPPPEETRSQPSATRDASGVPVVNVVVEVQLVGGRTERELVDGAMKGLEVGKRKGGGEGERCV